MRFSHLGNIDSEAKITERVSPLLLMWLPRPVTPRHEFTCRVEQVLRDEPTGIVLVQ